MQAYKNSNNNKGSDLMKVKGLFIICILLLSVFMITSVCASEDIDDSGIGFYEDSIEIDDANREDLKSDDDSYELQENSGELLKNGFDDEPKGDSIVPQIECRKHVWKNGVYNVSVTLPEDYNGNFSTFSVYPTKEVLLVEGSVVNGSGIFELAMEKTHFVDSKFGTLKFKYVDNIKNYSYSTTLRIYGYNFDHNDLRTITHTDINKKRLIFSESNKEYFTFYDESNTGFFDLYIDGIFYETKEAKYDTPFIIIPSNLSLGLHTYNLLLRDSAYYGNVNLSSTFEIVPISVLNVESSEYDEHHTLYITLAENTTGYVKVFLNGTEIDINSQYNRSEYSEELPEQLLFKKNNEISLIATPNGDYQGLVYFYSNLRNEPYIIPFFYINSKKYDLRNWTYYNAITIEDMYENDTHVVSINLPGVTRGYMLGSNNTDDNDIGQLYVKCLSGSKVIKTYSEYVKKGTAKIIIPPSDDITKISAGFQGITNTLNVNPITEDIIHKPKLNMSVYDAKEGLIVRLSENTSGCVEVKYGNESHFGFVVNGEALFPNFHPLKKVTISYADMDRIRSIKNKTFPVKLLEIDSELVIDTPDITVGSDAIIKISTIDELNEQIVVSVNDDDFTVDIVNGSGTLNMTNLSLGTYVVNAYIGDKYIKAANVTKTFSVVKKSPCLSVNADNIYVGQNLEITVGANKDISDNIILNVNNKDYSLKLINGRYTLKIADLNVGNYKISLNYDGNMIFANDSVITEVKVLPKVSPNLIIGASDIQKGEVALININVNESINGNIQVCINDINYTVKLVNGEAALSIIGLDPGNYMVRAIFEGNDKFSAQNETETFKVSYIPKVTAKATSVLYSSKGKYSVTVYGNNGKVAKNVTVVFKIAGKKVASVKTNSKGVASFTVTKVPGTYKVSATALGKTATKTLTVKHLISISTVKVKKSSQKLVLTATLKKINGKYLKNKKITFKFNGKKYIAKTNKKGVAKITIKKSVLKKLKVNKKVTYQATYLKDTVKKSVKVKK